MTEKEQELRNKAFLETMKAWTAHNPEPFKLGYEEDLYKIASWKRGKVKVDPVDLLDYKKMILIEISSEYLEYERMELMENVSTYLNKLSFTDEELLNNRVVNSTYPNGIKVTKLVSKTIRDMRGASREYNESALDYFHKPSKLDGEFYIDSDPMSFAEAYLTTTTCVSPQGEEQENIFKFLASPYIYIAYNEDRSNRMLIYEDTEHKLVFLNRVYGKNNRMFEYSIIQYYKNRGYKFLKHIEDRFNIDFPYIYIDSDTLYCKSFLKGIGAEFFVEEEGVDFSVNLFYKPDGLILDSDVFYHSAYFGDRSLTTSHDIRFGHYCGICETTVHEDEYDFQMDCCFACNTFYCEECGDYFSAEDYNLDTEICHFCEEQKRKGDDE